MTEDVAAGRRTPRSRVAAAVVAVFLLAAVSGATVGRAPARSAAHTLLHHRSRELAVGSRPLAVVARPSRTATAPAAVTGDQVVAADGSSHAAPDDPTATASPLARPAVTAAPTSPQPARPQPAESPADSPGVPDGPLALVPPGAEGPLTDVPAGWTAVTHGLEVDGLDRSYLVVRPPATTGADLPVVVVLHGRFLTPNSIERITQFLPVVGKAIMVYPAGYSRSWNAGGCCGIAHVAGVDDVEFLNSVVHQVLASQTGASARQVYLVGYSNGGRMAYRMACADPGTWAGVAAVEAVPAFSCDRTTPTPLLVVASTADPLLVLPADGPRKVVDHFLEPTVGATIDDWRRLDGCGPASTTVATGAETVRTWSSCRGAGRVGYAVYQGGAHAWPAGSAITPSAQRLIWDWMHREPVRPA